MTRELIHPTKDVSFVPFQSILFDNPESGREINKQEAPDFFADLNLDQIVESITSGRDEYNLKPFFYIPLKRVEAINYRQEILRDLENRSLFGYIESFAQQMRTMREHLAQAEKLHYQHQKESWFLDAVETYCGAVSRLTYDLTSTDLRSRGLLAFREYLTNYTESDGFTSLVARTKKLKADLSKVVYCLHINGSRIKVSRYDSEHDYGVEVLQTFEKFQQGEPRQYQFNLSSHLEMNHVEAAILDLITRLYPDIFLSLGEYRDRHSGFLDGTIGEFDREVQFYVACLDHIERFKTAGLVFCYPGVTDRSKEIYARDIFDLALAKKLIPENAPVVTNNFHLVDPERILVVSGPNQGGKTTFARTFGQLHYLASVGCPVPAREARLFLFDRLFTHFEKEENIRNLSGKLEDDLLRIHQILEQATPMSILIMNESFVSTTLSDALFLSKQIMQRIIRRDMLCVSVTFLDELASLSKATVSLVSSIDPENPAMRTFEVVRRPADGLAYAVAIAQKYHLTYEDVKERIA
jgi:hypothetical protein